MVPNSRIRVVLLNVAPMTSPSRIRSRLEVIAVVVITVTVAAVILTTVCYYGYSNVVIKNPYMTSWYCAVMMPKILYSSRI